MINNELLMHDENSESKHGSSFVSGSSPKITNVNSQWTSEVYFANFDVNSDCPSKALLTLKFGFQWSFGFSMTKDVSSIYLSQS